VRFVRLVALSGGLEYARRAVAERYPSAEVEVLDKERLRGRGRLRLLAELRRRPADRFVFFTFVNAWQLGRAPMALYARLSGARRVVFLDFERSAEEFGAARVLLREAPRTALELLLAGPVIALGLAATWALGLAAGRAPRAYPGAARSSERPLDVLFVRPTPTIGVQEAGESAHIRGVLDGLVELGHHPRVLANDDLPGVRRAGHEVDVRRPGALFNATPLAFEVWNNFVFTAHLWREARRRRPDLVYQRYSRNSWAGVAVSRLEGLPLLLEWNGSEVWAMRHWSPKGWWAHVVAVFERVNRRGAGRVVVVSRALADALVADGFDEARVVVNPNGVNPERFRPGAGGELVRTRYDLGDRIVVGFVGGFNYYQGTPVLMRAAPEVCRRADARFLLVGYGELLAATRAAAAEGGVADRVVFTDRVPIDEVPAHLDACDIAVAPMVPNPDGSDFFNSPVKIFEYMASGRAIVASRLGQIVEVIEEGETGLLVEPESPEALSEAIVRLALDRDLRERLGRNARRAAVERHTWRRNAARALEAYDDLVAGRAR
jgi:glycosyltransferase involved in cell wall biosynthesis